MYQINNEKFGQFLAEVRKEKQMTQKDLADKLFVSDKTVSKWERGNSIKDRYLPKNSFTRMYGDLKICQKILVIFPRSFVNCEKR